MIRKYIVDKSFDFLLSPKQSKTKTYSPLTFTYEIYFYLEQVFKQKDAFELKPFHSPINASSHSSTKHTNDKQEATTKLKPLTKMNTKVKLLSNKKKDQEISLTEGSIIQDNTLVSHLRV